MKQSVIAAAELLFLFSVAVVAIGQEQAPPQDQPRADTTQSISGTIKDIDGATNQLAVMTPDLWIVSRLFLKQVRLSLNGDVLHLEALDVDITLPDIQAGNFRLWFSSTNTGSAAREKKGRAV